MTKQEYQSSTAIIMADKKLGQTNRMIELRYIDKEYIASLEAENAALTAKNAKQAQIIDKTWDAIVNSYCPGEKTSLTCNLKDCAACWREFLMQEGDKNGKD